MKVEYYLGVDIGEQYAVISHYQQNMQEPETRSLIAGSQQFQIPLMVAKRKKLSQWYFGEEARKLSETGEVICIDNLFQRAVEKEEIVIEEETFFAEDLFALFLKKIISLPQNIGANDICKRIAISIEHLTKENVEMFSNIAQKLHYSQEQLIVLDYQQSFYHFLFHQSKELWLHEVFLFQYDGENMKYFQLKRNQNTIPQLVSVRESARIVMTGNRDVEFQKVLNFAFQNKIVSSVYLVGKGFEEDWMKDSLKILCRGKRVFVGNNLFSKGACYAAAHRDETKDWPYVYMGENEMKFNLSLKVKNRGTDEFYNLISAGKNWFEASASCEVIIKDVPEIDFWKQLPHSKEAKIETLQITDLPKRPNKTTRIRITAKPIADDKIELDLYDVGFGELFPSTGKNWKYIMSM